MQSCTQIALMAVKISTTSVVLMRWMCLLQLPGHSFMHHSWWRHQMEAFSALLAICAGNSPVGTPVNSPHKGQWRGSLMFSLICAWINRWVNNREAGDLRRYRTHYDVIVMGQAVELPAGCSLFARFRNFGKNSRTNTVEVFIIDTFFKKL